MSTKSIIVMEDNEGLLTTVSAISCRCDGYPEHNGAILSEYYTNPDKVRKLIALGNLDYLGIEVEPDRTTKKFGASWQEGSNKKYNDLMKTLSTLKPNLGFKVDCELKKEADTHTIAYKRDCGESGNQCHTYNSVDELLHDKSDFTMYAEYIYLYKNGRWSFFDVAKGKWNKLN